MSKWLGILLLISQQVMAKEECSKITISSHPDYPPFHWRVDDRLIGASIEVSKNIFSELGIEVDVKYIGPWKRVLKSAKDGKIDFIPALKKTKSRQEFLQFTSNAFASNPVAVFMRKDETRLPSKLSDLEGLFGSISAGDKHGEPIDSFLDKQRNLQRIHGIAQNFQMLDLKRTDYFVDGFYSAHNFLVVNNSRGLFKVPLLFEEPKVHNGFTKAYGERCPEVLKQFDRRLKLMSKSTEITNAIERYNQIWMRTHH
jgi:polar amino acid transport system substrate-binding protein